MATISEQTRTLQIVKEADVVVAGGGPAGFAAAVAAGRRGARTLLIERYGFLGGLATGGLVAPILGHTAHESETPIVEGILRELTERMHNVAGAVSWEESLKHWGINFEAEAFKYCAESMAEEAGVDVMLHTFVADTVSDDGRLSALIVESKSGRQAAAGTMFVDATGDADVAFRAGARTTLGRTFDGQPQSMGSFVHIGGISDASPDQVAAAKKVIEAEMSAGRLHFYNSAFANTNTVYHDHASPNMARWPGDSTNVTDLTRGEIGVRREMWRLIELLRKQPGFENAYIQRTSTQIGPRESRQIVGPYVLTGDDVHLGRKFDDSIARGSWWIDIHCPLGETYPIHLCERECPKQADCPYWAAEHETTMRTDAELYPPAGDWYDIPYRCMLPEGFENLAVAGRCISADHHGMAGARVMGTCVALGQAAGTAAALAADEGTTLSGLNVGQVQSALREDGQLV